MVSYCTHHSIFLLNIKLLLIWNSWREREEGKEAVREKHQFVVPFVYAFTGYFLYVPQLKIKPTTLAYGGNTLTSWATPPEPTDFKYIPLDTWNWSPFILTAIYSISLYKCAISPADACFQFFYFKKVQLIFLYISSCWHIRELFQGVHRLPPLICKLFNAMIFVGLFIIALPIELYIVGTQYLLYG